MGIVKLSLGDFEAFTGIQSLDSTAFEQLAALVRSVVLALVSEDVVVGGVAFVGFCVGEVVAVVVGVDGGGGVLFLFMFRLDSEVSMSSGKVTSFVTTSSSSPTASTAASLPAWLLAVLVRVVRVSFEDVILLPA